MTSKERVFATLAGKEPDRVPKGEFGIDHDHVSKIIGRHSYWRNRRDTTLAMWDGRRDEVVESLKRDCAAFVDALGYDIVTVDLVAPKGHKPEKPREVSEGRWEDSKGNVYLYAASNDSIQRVTPSEAKEEITDEDVRRAWEKVEAMDDSIFELVDYIGDRYGDEKVVLFRGIDIYGGLMSPFGGDYNHQLIMTKLGQDDIKRMYAPLLAHNKKILDHCARHKVSVAMQGQDFGMNTGTIISPADLRELFFPFINMVNREIEEHGMLPFYHCCGKIWDIMDDYVASGYRAYQSIQASAGMDWKRVKELYGDKLALWCGVQCETMVSGSLDDIEREVTGALRDLMPGGRFIFGSTNSVQFGAKTENYLRALELVNELGAY